MPGPQLKKQVLISGSIGNEHSVLPGAAGQVIPLVPHEEESNSPSVNKIFL